MTSTALAKAIFDEVERHQLQREPLLLSAIERLVESFHYQEAIREQNERQHRLDEIYAKHVDKPLSTQPGAINYVSNADLEPLRLAILKGLENGTIVPEPSPGSLGDPKS